MGSTFSDIPKSKDALISKAKDKAIDKISDLTGLDLARSKVGEPKTQSIPLNKDIKDKDWIRQVMFVPQAIPTNMHNARAGHIMRNREYTPGVLNFADTTLGGNRSINPRPQFTEFADQNVESLLAGISSDTTLNAIPGSNLKSGGMGRYYAEAIDSNAQRIYMDFGVPHFNSLTSFFGNFYDQEQGQLANQGIMSGLTTTLLKVAGYCLFWYIVFPLKIMQGVSTVINFLQRTPSSRYYYMRPTMHVYWQSVAAIVSNMSVNMGLSPGYDPQNYGHESEIKEQLKAGQSNPESMIGILSDKEKEAYRQLLPDIYLDNGTIDPMRVAIRYQRLSNQHRLKFESITAGAQSPEDLYNKIQNYIKSNQRGLEQPVNPKNMQQFIDEYKKTQAAAGVGIIDLSMIAPDGTVNQETADADAKLKNIVNAEAAKEAAEKEAEKDGATKAQDGASLQDAATQATAEGVVGGGGWFGIGNWARDNFSMYKALVDDGQAWVSFIVDYESGISESISSSTKQSSIAEAMNSTSSSARSALFNVAGGNIGDGAFNVLETVMGGVKSLFQSGLNSIGLQGLSALGGAAFVDIPDFWDNTETNLPTASYTIQLRSPYGNTQSLFQNIYFPLAMLLAAALPRSTGKSSYTGPFLCRLWHKGRVQIQLGIISDMTISRGTSNIGWNGRDQATAIDVSFSVKNLSRMLHMPINNETKASDILGLNVFTEENNYTDYMAVLAGLGLSEQFYHMPNLMRQHMLSLNRWDNTFNAVNMMSSFNDEWTVGRVINWFGREAQF